METALQKYHDTVGAAEVPFKITQMREARRADGSVLEYGLKYHLERLSKATAKPITSFMPDMDKEAENLTLWLTQFKEQLGKYKEAQPTIDEVQAELDKYNKGYLQFVKCLTPLAVGAARVGLEIKASIDAKRADGSPLEYGLEFHLNRVAKSKPEDAKWGINEFERHIDELEKELGNIKLWLNQFSEKFGSEAEAKPTIDKVSDALGKWLVRSVFLKVI